VPLVAIGAVAGFIGGSLVGQTIPFAGTVRMPILLGLVLACFNFIMAIVGIGILAVIINALAPSFGGEKNGMQALKVAVYSYTPAWIAGVLNIVPLLGVLGVFGALYGLYLLYLGLPRLMRSPEDKALGYTAVVVVCAIVLSVVVMSTGGLLVGAGAFGAGALTGGLTQAGAGGLGATTSGGGRLEELGRQLEAAGQKADEAERRGDTAGQAAAALGGLGALLGGGARVDPLDIEQLKPFIPDTFAGLAKTSSRAERTGFAPLMVSKAEATYEQGERRINLEITDTGGVSGLVAFAGWAGIQGESEDESGSERTAKVGDRIVHEKRSKVGGQNEFGLVVGDRFVVNASGGGVDLETLRAAVSSLDLARLESMKNVGVQK
jgi:Yip1-like protein